MQEPVGAEVAEIVAEYGWAVARRYRPWLLPRWEDFKGKILEKLFRQRAEKALREEQTLYEVARALVKAEGDKEVGLVKKESAGLSFDDTSPKAVPRDVLETAVTMASPHRFKNPERAVAARELRDWLISAVGALDDDALETFAKEWARCHGEFQTLGEALGVNESTARSRLLRFRRELGAYAETTGAVDLASMLDSRLRGRPEAPPPARKEQPTRPGHRLEDLTLYRAGDLAPAQRDELEQHLSTCEECRRSLRALDATRDAFKALLVAPPLPWPRPEIEKLVAALEKKYRPGGRGKPWKWIALGLLAAGAAAAIWLFGEPAPKPLPPSPPARPSKPAAVPPRQPLYSAPGPGLDAGADGGR